MIVREVLESLLEILEAIDSQVHESILVHLKDFQSRHSSNQSHKIVVIRLELSLV